MQAERWWKTAQYRPLRNWEHITGWGRGRQAWGWEWSLVKFNIRVKVSRRGRWNPQEKAELRKRESCPWKPRGPSHFSQAQIFLLASCSAGDWAMDAFWAASHPAKQRKSKRRTERAGAWTTWSRGGKWKMGIAGRKYLLAKVNQGCFLCSFHLKELCIVYCSHYVSKPDWPHPTGANLSASANLPSEGSLPRLPQPKPAPPFQL